MDCIGCARESDTLVCLDCDDRGWTEDSCGCVRDPQLKDVIRCDNCNEQMAVEQYESDMSAYHGGTAPQSWYDNTAAQRRSA